MAKRGIKTCPNCNFSIGARCIFCRNCFYHFSTKEVNKALFEEKNKKKDKTVKVYNTMGKGRKQCPDCKVIVSSILSNCHKCNFDFSSAKKEKDALLEKKRGEKEEIREEKRKKKEETLKERKEKKEEKEVIKISPIVRELLTVPVYVAPKRLSSKEHAERILSYGVERAKILLHLAKNHGYWKHVNWDIVEKGLV